MQRQIRFTSWNTRGMSAALPQLRLILKESDFSCICEHWLHENKLNLLDEIDHDFNFIARSSKHSKSEDYGIGRGQGGVALFWRKTLPAVTPLNDLCHDRVCGVRFEPKPHCVFNILSIYLPDVSSPESICDTLDEISAIIENFELGSQTIICGDFNGDVGKNFGSHGNNSPNRQGHLVSIFIKKYNLFPTNTCATTIGPIETFNGFNSSSTLDYICVPTNLLPNPYKVCVKGDEALNTSDHNIVDLCIDIGDICMTTFEVNKISHINWNKIDTESLNLIYTIPVSLELTELSNRFDLEPPSQEGIDGYFKTIVNIMTTHDKNLPRRRVNKRLRPYWNEELSDLKRSKILAYKFWISNGRPRDNSNISYVKYKTSKRNFMKRLRQLHKTYENDELAKIIKSSEVDRKYFWRSLRKARSTNTASVLSIKNSDKKVVHDINGVLRVWELYFDHLSTPKDLDKYDKVHKQEVDRFIESKIKQRDIDQFTSDPFTSEEISKAISKLHNAKAPGYDLITTEHIKYAGTKLVEILTKLFNVCINSECVPENFKRRFIKFLLLVLYLT